MPRSMNTTHVNCLEERGTILGFRLPEHANASYINHIVGREAQVAEYENTGSDNTPGIECNAVSCCRKWKSRMVQSFEQSQ